MINVLFIAYHFPPVGGAGVQRTVKFVRYLPAFGYLPVIITGPGSTDGRWTPLDKEMLKQISPDVRIYRTEGHAPQESANKLVRALQRLFCLPGNFSKWWISSAVSVAEKAISEQNISLIYASMSPFESAVVAQRLSEKFKIPWIADLRDPWALDEMQVFYSGLHRIFHLKKMYFSLLSASTIVMNTPEAASAMKRIFRGSPEKKIVAITNGFDKEDFNDTAPSRTDIKFRIVHSGYLHTGAGLDLERKRRFLEPLGGIKKGLQIFTRSHIVLLKSVDHWLKEMPDVINDLEIYFAGVVTDADVAIAKKSFASKVIHFIGYTPHTESIKLVRTADLLFLPMHNIQPGSRTTIVPGKLYEYMASGRPILAAVPDGDARDYLLAGRTALICDPDNPEEMTRILNKAYDAWKNKRPLITPDFDFIARFERKILTGELAKAFGNALDHKQT